jgi:hypothetical protein
VSDLIQQLRAMSRHEHSDLSLGDEAADAIERLMAERDAARADERERCITVAEDAYIAGRGAKGCIDAIRAIGR